MTFSQHWYRRVTEWPREESEPRYVSLSLILQLLESPLHGKIQVKLNQGILSKYSEEVPIRIDSHNVPVQVNQAIIFLMYLFLI